MPQNKERSVVFVVEDGDGTRQLSCLVLESYGFTCRSAHSVEEALTLIESDPRVDVLFSDIHFPDGLTGVDLAQKMANAPYNLPVLLTSGLAVEYVEEILPDGVAFLEKPYTPEQLLSAIRSVMSERRALATPVA